MLTMSLAVRLPFVEGVRTAHYIYNAGWLNKISSKASAPRHRSLLMAEILKYGGREKRQAARPAGGRSRVSHRFRD